MKCYKRLGSPLLQCSSLQGASFKQFLTRKSITEIENQPFSSHLVPNDFWLFLNINSFLKRRRVQAIKNIQKNIKMSMKHVPEQELQNVSNSDSIVGLSA
jgi:hypothetical protein